MTVWLGLAWSIFAADAFGATQAPARGESASSSSSQVLLSSEQSEEFVMVNSLPDLDEDTGRFVGPESELRRDIVLYVDKDKARAKHTSKLPIGRRGLLIPVQTVSLSGGRADAVFLKSRQQRGVLIQSGPVQAIATGGRMAVVAQEDIVTVAALHGDALVGKAGSFKTLKEGNSRTFYLKKGAIKDTRHLGAPEVSAQGLGVSLSGGLELGLKASQVPGASAYRTILLNSEGKQVGDPAEAKNPRELMIRTPRAGAYWVVVRALDQFGIAGASSEPVALQVLGLENGSQFVRDGIIFLGPGERARILGQRGLVMRYGTSPEFVAAPESIGLPGRKATTVEFRDPGDPSKYAVFQLAPRVLRSTLDLGPGKSTWPKDPIQMRVRMWDGHGEPLSWIDEYKVVVKVNLKEVAVDWTRGNGELSAELPPEKGEGPWVVRLIVLDSMGKEIARNILEVIKDVRPEKRTHPSKIARVP